ncbi:hypothetical protein SK128_013249 [Halocaridina rubra]|uniref:Uncharacterized protein n=1 Tax=Halocaridina rubra TaxID=373956 RepID=A0AAN8ZNU4_HALRR
MYPDLRFCATKPLVTFAQQRGNYTVLENYIPAGKSFRCHESITYTTHSEYSFLHNVDNIVDRWQGPVSVAVYTPGTDFERALKTILYLRNCMSEDIKTYVSFHVFYHKDHKPEKIPLPEDVMSMNSDCSSGLPDWTNVTTYRRQNKLLYPVNVGRNAARLAAQTYFVFPSDVELYPSIKVIPGE